MCTKPVNKAKVKQKIDHSFSQTDLKTEMFASNSASIKFLTQFTEITATKKSSRIRFVVKFLHRYRNRLLENMFLNEKKKRKILASYFMSPVQSENFVNHLFITFVHFFVGTDIRIWISRKAHIL